MGRGKTELGILRHLSPASNHGLKSKGSKMYRRGYAISAPSGSRAEQQTRSLVSPTANTSGLACRILREWQAAQPDDLNIVITDSNRPIGPGVGGGSTCSSLT